MLVETDDPRVGKAEGSRLFLQVERDSSKGKSLAPKLDEYGRLVLSETFG